MIEMIMIIFIKMYLFVFHINVLDTTERDH